jgi:hypothetical protein
MLVELQFAPQYLAKCLPLLMQLYVLIIHPWMQNVVNDVPISYFN